MKFTKRRKRYLQKRIITLRGRGLTNKAIAAKLHISESSVYRLAGNAKPDGIVWFPKGSAPASSATKALAVRLLGFGLGGREVGWLFGKSPLTVRRWKRDFSGPKNPTL